MRPAERSKYGAIPTTVDGYRFASKAEARRYGEIKLLEKAGLIEKLMLQERFLLLVHGVKIGTYVADFSYMDCQGDTPERIVEDVKSRPTRTAVYRLKKKLVYALYGVEIREVE